MPIQVTASNPPSRIGPASTHLNCPACRRPGTFDPLAEFPDFGGDNSLAIGYRRCPNPACRAVVCVIHRGGEVLSSYPPQTIEFDPAHIPTGILQTFAEAIIDHSNESYRSAAMMVRRTLEELCEDQGATGKTLHDRLLKLQTKLTLPKDYFDAMFDLKLFGNDAAHIELKDFDHIGKEEVEDSIEITKELLRGIYQTSHLMSKMAKYKKTTP